MKNELLKNAILRKYRSVREFAIALKIAPSTIQSAIDNDSIGRMAVDTIIKMCDDLGNDIKTFEPIDEKAVIVTDRKEQTLCGADLGLCATEA